MNETRLKQIEDRWLNATRLPYEESIVVIRADILSLTAEVRRLQGKEATLDAMVREAEIRLSAPAGSVQDWDGIQSLSPPSAREDVSKESERMNAIEARLNVLEMCEQERASRRLTRVFEKEARMGKPTGLPTARDRYEKNDG